MMKIKNQKGFAAIEIILIVIIVGMIGGVGYFVYNANKKTSNESNNTTIAKQEDKDNSYSKEIKTVDGFKYNVPSGWQYVKSPFIPYEEGSQNILLSPDYKEAGEGQLNIKTGSFIDFGNDSALTMFNIKPDTTIDQAIANIKNSKNEVTYSDPGSAKKTTIGDKEVIIYNAGHTTDGVNVLHKTKSQKWIVASFNTSSGDDNNYNAENSPHYKTFVSWLEEFIKINP